jgi:hypothetical protein
MVDPAELAAATNHIHEEVFKAKGAEANGNYEEMVRHYRSAIVAACEMMSRLTDEEIDANSTAKNDLANDHLYAVLQDEANARSFFEAERKVLKEIGLHEGIANYVTDRCVDFIGSEPAQWGNPDIGMAFRAAKFRVCTTGIELVEKLEPTEESVLSARKVGRIAVKNAFGATIIVANWTYFAPVEVFFGLSTAFGGTWLGS